MSESVVATFSRTFGTKCLGNKSYRAHVRTQQENNFLLSSVYVKEKVLRMARHLSEVRA